MIQSLWEMAPWFSDGGMSGQAPSLSPPSLKPRRPKSPPEALSVKILTCPSQKLCENGGLNRNCSPKFWSPYLKKFEVSRPPLL